jgi:8-oxo-dGTP pyrophosphatase MutT (NUDIX family)
MSAAESPMSWILQLREQLASPAPRRLPASDDRPAAVLVPLYIETGQLWVLLTRRAADLPHHRSQIAFPGGGRELGEGIWDAALRETSEELGLDAGRILRLGELDEVTTPSGYRIVPCVGAIPWPVETEPNPTEIEEVFSVPLLSFANPRLVEERKVLLDGRERAFRIYHIGGRQVWGLTARIVHNLMARLGVEPPAESE